jgi:hypothetical protein
MFSETQAWLLICCKKFLGQEQILIPQRLLWIRIGVNFDDGPNPFVNWVRALGPGALYCDQRVMCHLVLT